MSEWLSEWVSDYRNGSTCCAGFGQLVGMQPTGLGRISKSKNNPAIRSHISRSLNVK